MTGLGKAPSDDVPTSTPQRQSRFFWTTIALAIAAMLILCTILVLIAATRG
jgi:hypothetical protein